MWSCECKCFSGPRRQRRRRSLPTERRHLRRGHHAVHVRRLAGAFGGTFMISGACPQPVAHTRRQRHVEIQSLTHMPYFGTSASLHLRFRVPLPSSVKCRRFLWLEAMVPMGSLASTKFPQPADRQEQAVAAHHSSTSDKPARVTARSLGAALASMSLDSCGYRSRSCTTLACRAQGARFSGRFLRVTHHGDHCAAPLLAPHWRLATSTAWQWVRERWMPQV